MPDLPTRVYRPVRRFGVELARHLRDHDIDDLAAMMTYYAIMALFPMVLFVFTIALVALPAPVGDFVIQVNNRKIANGFFAGLGLTDVAATLRAESSACAPPRAQGWPCSAAASRCGARRAAPPR